MTQTNPGKKIPSKHYRLAYEQAKLVFEKLMKRADAVRICKAAGMNPATASFYIGNLPQLLRGHLYHRRMSAESTQAILEWILKDYGDFFQRNAITSVLLHIEYLRIKTKGNPVGLTRMVTKLSKDLGKNLVSPGIDDIPEKPLGNQCPDRALVSGVVVVRDPSVRAHVVRRARGKCEYCGIQGFSLPNGKYYVEVHHIIYLAKDGPDTLENVIALCPSHHREAHFGVKAEALEKELLEKLKIILSRNE